MAKRNIRLNKRGTTTTAGQKLAKLQGEISKKEYVHVPVDKLRVSPLNKYPLGDMEEITAEVGEYGVLHNLIIIGPYDDGHFDILSGQRRHQAILNNWEKGNMVHKKEGVISLIFPPTLDELEQRIIIHMTNRQREYDSEATRQQVSELYNAFVEKKKKGENLKGSITENLAEIFNVKVRQIQKLVSIEKKGIPAIAKLLDKGTITVDTAAAIVQLDPDVQTAAVKEIKDGKKLTPVDIKAYKEFNRKNKENIEEIESADTQAGPLKESEKISQTSKQRISHKSVAAVKAQVTVTTAIEEIDSSINMINKTDIPPEEQESVAKALQDISKKIDDMIRRLNDETSETAVNV